MTHHLELVRQLAEKVRENLQKCAHDPDVGAVHDTRTGTRRLQATLEDALRPMPQGDAADPVRSAATELLRQLKKIRRAAGPIRDLDVHRKLLEKLMERAHHPGAAAGDGHGQPGKILRLASAEPDVLETQAAGRRPAGVGHQANGLDTWLRHRRNNLAEELQSQASGMLAKLNKRLQEFEADWRARRGRASKKKPPGVVALDSFARLATEMQVLDAGNLHDFRKGAKKARYVAELAAQGDEHAQQVGATLKKLQDEIGDWHDWLVLAGEAQAALGDRAAELTALLESEREKHFVCAMKTAAKLRGRLMGEWLAVKKPSPHSIQRSAR